MKISREMLVYLGRLLFERMLGLGLFLWGTRGALYSRGAVYFACYFGSVILSAIALRGHRGTLHARARVSRDTPLWDKLILTAFWLIAYFIIYFVAGRSYNPAKGVRFLTVLGVALYWSSVWLTDAALAANPFAESTARLQKERRQKVARGGPYKAVRHPMYAAILLWCLAIVCIFPRLSVAMVAAAAAILIIYRTWLEDNMLLAGLHGYQDYARRTRYRLVPMIW